VFLKFPGCSSPWKAGIGRMVVPGQSRQKSLQDRISREKSWAGDEGLPSQLLWEAQNRIGVEADLGRKQGPISKRTRAEKNWGHDSSSRAPA
jgi:hypothetical protein